MVTAEERRRLLLAAGWYGLGAGALGAGIAFGIGFLAGVPTPLVAILLALVGFSLACFTLGVSDEGLETVSAGAEVGFSGGNPTAYQPDALPGVDRLAVLCFFAGLALYGGVVLALFL